MRLCTYIYIYIYTCSVDVRGRFCVNEHVRSGCWFVPPCCFVLRCFEVRHNIFQLFCTDFSAGKCRRNSASQQQELSCQFYTRNITLVQRVQSMANCGSLSRKLQHLPSKPHARPRVTWTSVVYKKHSKIHSKLSFFENM